MKGKGKWTPHIIAAMAIVVFIVLGLACMTTPNKESPSIAEGTTEIKAGAFRNKDYTFVIIPYGVQKIGELAFANNKIRRVVIPDTVTEIGRNAFGANSLKRVFIPGSVITMGENVFDTGVVIIRDSSLPGEYIGDYKVSVTNGAATITRHRGRDLNIEIPAEINGMPVTAIGQYAFFQKMLTGVTIPDTVRTIGNYAFADNNLENLVLPDNVRISSNTSFQEAFNINVNLPGVTTINEAQVNDSLIRNYGRGGYKNYCRISNPSGKKFIPVEQETFTVGYDLELPASGSGNRILSYSSSFTFRTNLIKGHNYSLLMTISGVSITEWGVEFNFYDSTTRQTINKKNLSINVITGRVTER